MFWTHHKTHWGHHQQLCWAEQQTSVDQGYRIMCKGRAQSCRAPLKTSKVIWTVKCNQSPETNLSVKSPTADFIWKLLALRLETSRTDLYCCVLRGWHHDAEDGVENYTGDRTAVATQRILFWWAWDPLFGVTLLSNGPTQSELIFSFV